LTTTIGWRFVNKLMKTKYGVDSMPETAENVADQFNISRADQDLFAMASQVKNKPQLRIMAILTVKSSLSALLKRRVMPSLSIAMSIRVKRALRHWQSSKASFVKVALSLLEMRRA